MYQTRKLPITDACDHCLAYCFFRRARLIAGQGARDNEDAQSFGYRYDDDLTQRFADPTSATFGKTCNAETIPGFTSEMVVGFKPMLGLFNQFKYIH